MSYLYLILDTNLSQNSEITPQGEILKQKLLLLVEILEYTKIVLKEKQEYSYVKNKYMFQEALAKTFSYYKSWI